jgi:hypothetical protein
LAGALFAVKDQKGKNPLAHKAASGRNLLL